MTLSKDKAIKILSRYDNEHYTPATRQAHRMGAEALARDAAEVVRCKDCKNWEECYGSEGELGYCELERSIHTAPTAWYKDDYCSYGERMPDNVKEH